MFSLMRLHQTSHSRGHSKCCDRSVENAQELHDARLSLLRSWWYSISPTSAHKIQLSTKTFHPWKLCIFYCLVASIWSVNITTCSGVIACPMLSLGWICIFCSFHQSFRAKFLHRFVCFLLGNLIFNLRAGPLEWTARAWSIELSPEVASILAAYLCNTRLRSSSEM